MVTLRYRQPKINYTQTSQCVGVELRRWSLDGICAFWYGVAEDANVVRRLIVIGWSYVRGNVRGVCLNCRGTFLVFGICVRLNSKFKGGK
jgi:hypothetical protein